MVEVTSSQIFQRFREKSESGTKAIFGDWSFPEIGNWGEKWEIRLKKYIGIKLWKLCQLQGGWMLKAEKLRTVCISKESPTCSNVHSHGNQQHAPESPQIMVPLSHVLFYTPGTHHCSFCSRQKSIFFLLPKFIWLEMKLCSCFLSGEMENSCLPFSL